MERRCPYCREKFKRLDRHLSGRVGCAAEARRRTFPGEVVAPTPSGGRLATPDDLGPAGARLWAAVVGEYALDPHQGTVLEAACREADCAEAADRAVAAAGPFLTGRLGQCQVHPGVAAARAARLAMARLVRAATAPTDEAA